MENKNQMQTGTWDKIDTGEYTADDKVKFDVNITQQVVFISAVPEERTGMDGGVFYQWKVEVDKKPKILQTSAWTLLKELKKANLKAGSILNITKRLVKGKQFFEVK
jgi:hypothetical protein